MMKRLSQVVTPVVSKGNRRNFNSSSSTTRTLRAQDGNTKVDRSTKMAPFAETNPFEYVVKDDEYKGFKLGCYHEPSTKNPRAVIIFISDFGVTARSFGGFFTPFATDSELMMRTYCFDRRGFGKSEGERGLLKTGE